LKDLIRGEAEDNVEREVSEGTKKSYFSVFGKRDKDSIRVKFKSF
jgi:hypothetical protein